MTEFKDTNNSADIFGNMNTSLSPIYGKTRQNISKEMDDLNNMINYLDLTVLAEQYTQQLQNRYPFPAHRVHFTKTDRCPWSQSLKKPK